MAEENGNTPPGEGEEERSNHGNDDNASTGSSQILGASGLIKPGKYDEILELDEEWTKENDDRLKRIMKMRPKNPHIQDEEQRLKEKLKVVILSGKIKAGDKKLKEVTRQLDKALQLIEAERRLKEKDDEEIRKKHEGKINDTNRMRELEDSLNLGLG